MKFVILLCCVALSQALSFGKTNILVKPLVTQVVESEPITPYAFSYTADATDGSSARQETADANGVVRGSYSMVTADGIKRIVSYIADENGFRAQVDTNEPGTESKSSADVIMQSSQLPAEEIALKYGPRPDERQVVGLKTVPKAVVLNRPILSLIKPKTIVPEERLLTIGNIQSIPKQIETPIKLLSKISPKLSPFAFNVQQKEDLVSQNYESF